MKSAKIKEKKRRGPYKQYWSKDGPSQVTRTTITSRLNRHANSKSLLDTCSLYNESDVTINSDQLREAACVGSMPCFESWSLDVHPEEEAFIESDMNVGNQPLSPAVSSLPSGSPSLDGSLPEQDCSVPNFSEDIEVFFSLEDSFNDEFCQNFNVEDDCFSEEEASRNLFETPVNGEGEAQVENDAPPSPQTQTVDPDPAPSDDSDEEMAAAPQLHLTTEEKIKILLLLATKRRHKLSYTAAENIMQLSGVMSDDYDNAFLPSKHIMKRAIELYSFQLSEHYVCPACGFYIRVVPETSFHCMRCDKWFNTLKNRQEGNMFLVLPMEDQLRALFEKCVSREEFIDVQKREKINQYNYEDLFDGTHYIENFLPEFMTFNFFIDGLQIGSTTKTSALPLLVSVNELPLHLRRKYLMMASVWLGKKKPDCNEYLKPFVEQCIKLQTSGVSYQRNGVKLTQKFKPCVCISDSIARPPLRNCHQFNGKYGCGLCYHPGFRLPFGRGHVRSYSTQDRSYPLRTHEETMEYARQAQRTNKKHVMGVKGHAILSNIPGFDIVTQLDPDSFHCLVNVAKRFAWLWFSERFSKKAFNIHEHSTKVDARLLSITPTSDVSRLRSLTERSDYRGHEWYYWIVMFSIPCLTKILPNRYLNHWSLLVSALALLMQNSVAKSERAYAERYLNLFVSQIDGLYGAAHVTFSIHLLTHLAQSVSNFGQPWAHSAFFYEAENAEIKHEIHSHNGAIFQICKGVQLKVALKKLEHAIQHEMNNNEKEYLKKMSSSKVAAKPHLTIENFGFLGKPQISLLNPDSSSALTRSQVNFDGAVPHATYLRCVINNEEYHSTQYARSKKQNNCVALLDDDSVFIIDSFVVLNSNECFALGHYVMENKRVKICEPVPPHLRVLKMLFESTLRCIPMSLIQAKLLSFTVDISCTESIRLAYSNIMSMEMLR